jgi:ribosomal protein S18 acetylase RimI-like enzyme
MRFRALEATDARVARTLLLAELGATPWGGVPLDALAEAVRGDADCQGIVARHDDAVVGVVLFGAFAGTQGSARIRAIAVSRAAERRAEVADQLLAHALDTLRAHGARLVIAEIPGDPTLAEMLGVLARGGFRNEGEIPDFYRDGVSMVIVGRELTA